MASTDKTTVLDVARAASVAVGTVSRVLNMPDEVGPELRQRVLDAMARLGYRPLRRRRGGRNVGSRRGTGNIGLLFLGLQSLAQIPVLSEALRGVEIEVAASDSNLMMANLPTAGEVPLFLQKGMVDGVIVRSALAGSYPDLTGPALLEAIERVPHVWLVGKPAGAKGDVVESDLDAVGRIAAEYLAARGHEFAVTLDPVPSLLDVLNPLQTFALHARAFGIDVKTLEGPANRVNRWPAQPIANVGAVAPLVERWLATTDRHRPQTLVVGTDAVAIPLYSLLQQAGLTVGRDISVISLRMEPLFAGTLHPRITTVDNGADTIGRVAVRQLAWRFQHPNDGVVSRLRVSPTLVEGGSVIARV